MYNYDNWDDVKTKLIELYQDRKHHSQLIEELTNCRQESNESITEFYERLENLSCGIISSLKVDTKDKKSLSSKSEYVNEITLNRFIFHSHPKISQMLRWKNFNNLNSAYSAAIAEEKNLQMLKNSKNCNDCHCRNRNTSEWKVSSKPNVIKTMSSVQSQKICKYCKKSGHLLDECFLRKKNNELRDNQNVSSNQTLEKKFSFKLTTVPSGGHRTGGVGNTKFFVTNDNVNCMKVWSKNSKNPGKSLQLMLDTGSSINVIKACKLTPETKFNSKEKIKLQGIGHSQQALETVGSCVIPLRIEDKVIPTKFHILNQTTNIPYDGLLGKEFFVENSACINYEDNTIKLKEKPRILEVTKSKTEVKEKPDPLPESIPVQKEKSSSTNSSKKKAKEAPLLPKNKNKRKGPKVKEVKTKGKERSSIQNPKAKIHKHNFGKHTKKRKWNSSTKKTKKKATVFISTSFHEKTIPEVKLLLLSKVQLLPNEEDEKGQLKNNGLDPEKVPRENLNKNKIKSRQNYYNIPKFKGPYEIKKVTGNNIQLKIRN